MKAEATGMNRLLLQLERVPSVATSETQRARGAARRAMVSLVTLWLGVIEERH